MIKRLSAGTAFYFEDTLVMLKAFSQKTFYNLPFYKTKY